ncbi:fluoride efflux transporter FluC [Vreelandella utahensis]|uniref:fluoride efflux transporter FluC n=1 Tax=Vreelandella halophila TaxID=86177 RepID=UPI0009851979|nr:CrcB family protein [Halomonas utahensis]
MNQAITSLWVALGTALGGVIRYGVDRFMLPEAPFPWSTLVVNTLGSLLIGWIAGRATIPSSRLAHANLHAFLVPGFCAGLTTFSVFSHETLVLLRSGAVAAGTANITGTIVLMLLGSALGLAAGRRNMTDRTD